MLPTPMVAVDAESKFGDPHDQRSHHRYRITLDVEYKLLKRGRVVTLGSGKTVNISRGGVLIDATGTLFPGSRVEVMVHWPFLLEGVCPLKLVMRGRVVRSVGTSIAVQTSHHEFRTAGGRVTQSALNKVRSFLR